VSEQGIWTPRSSAEDLRRAAEQQGTPVTRRLIVDWTERGLLDRPRSRGQGQGRGREKGAWSWNQRQLFLALLRKRPAKQSQFPALFNIPVFLWLWWGGNYVPLDQARRCLLSWHRRLGHTSQQEARRAARRTVQQVAHPDADRRSRKILEEYLYAWGLAREVDRGLVRRLLRPVIDPHRTGKPRGPLEAPFTTESYLTRVEALITGETYVPTFIDSDFKQARSIYRTSRQDYARTWKKLAADQDLGSIFEAPTLDTVANNACTDLTLGLGLLKLRGDGVTDS